ncbi:MAG TPA: hypothetical protein VNF27_07180 [Candidatus Binataceae bacterium]|nr:hypothetical protein [Candidatus Binataceae bacterium]
MTTRFGYSQRREAGRRLPPGFSGRVVADARAAARGAGERRLMAITGAACIALVIAGHWAITAATSRANLEQWSSTANQIVALEETP